MRIPMYALATAMLLICLALNLGFWGGVAASKTPAPVLRDPHSREAPLAYSYLLAGEAAFRDAETDALAGDEVLWWGGEGPGGLGAGGARGALLGRLRDVGVAIEAACGGVPQDVEGVVTAEGEIAVVQARAQV